MKSLGFAILGALSVPFMILPQLTDPLGSMFVRLDNRQRISCVVAVSTATTIQAVGGQCVAPAAGTSIYVTDIVFGTNASAIAADTFNTLKYGTGGTCGAGTTVFYQCMTPAAAQASCNDHFIIPKKIPAANEICWINSTAGSKTLQIHGFLGP